MKYFTYTLPEYRFEGAPDLTTLTIADYEFMKNWGAMVDPKHPDFDTYVEAARKKHLSQSIALHKNQLRALFQEIRAVQGRAHTESTARTAHQNRVRKLRSEWCYYLAEFLRETDTFMFATSALDTMLYGDEKNDEDIYQERLERAKDTLQKMIQYSGGESQLGGWSFRKIYIRDDFVLHWDDS